MLLRSFTGSMLDASNLTRLKLLLFLTLLALGGPQDRHHLAKLFCEVKNSESWLEIPFPARGSLVVRQREL
jgi:hypothetical protein